MAKTILITGASRGFGKLWAKAFLKRGDKVAATARKLADLDDLVSEFGDQVTPIQLDVNNRTAVFEAVKYANASLGSIDVLINNAGFGLFGTIEETSEDEARQQIETNVFGLLWVTQAVLPIMRKQGHGHIIQVSSVLGITTLPTLGIYNASKFAVEGLSETLASEVAGFGIKVSLIEPNGFATDWAGASASQAKPMDEYAAVHAGFKSGLTPDIFGDPAATSAAVLKLVDSENPPLRLFLGKVAYPWAKQVYEQKLATWEEWNDVAVAAHGA
ncbi:short-chain dehydrogenase/reductase [Mucilaginibacter sp. PPCGB 2223]|uniref:SDR family NAD(P)-dependent oxidoreductase n=1 Tax=Mucilaginibacter sp. PPCGB 2223 TaxID=1886027 RepID=UPI0008240DA3|nr:SDR family NAD(P)-dependent oxidoreductase [Mucilaginibacter sp. PPCGB 2223]OCX50371.1 short-chain dehydrogenase/reductase [Mucilaginibacter sp. PPCGB 2223]